jgi:Phage phiEco32-like COOH.NH2 ligase-type 2
MHKLCSIKDVTPGSVIELPKQYQVKDGETAVLLGLEYASDKKHIYAQALRSVGEEFVEQSLSALDEDDQLTLVDDAVLQRSAIKSFVAQKIALPALGMSAGCDPEIFVTHADGSVFPAWEFMPSEEEAQKSKKEWLTTDLGSRWAVPSHVFDCPTQVPAYWDGVQAEFAPWAKSCLETLHFGTRSGLKAVLDFARAKDVGARLTLQNVVELPESVLKGADDQHIRFRCSQSLNVYNDPGDGIPDARAYKYRCAGGHIHIGFTRAFTAPGLEQIIRCLDGVLATIGVSLAAGIDNPERRHTYGRAGEFRLPQYGLEYRVLSNFWLAHPAIAMLVFEISRAAVRLAQSGLYNLCWVAEEQEIRDVINNCDVNGARKILNRNIAVLSGMLNGVWAANDRRPEVHVNKMKALALKTIFNGMDAAISDPLNIEKNWDLGNPEWKRYCRGENCNWELLAIK